VRGHYSAKFSRRQRGGGREYDDRRKETQTWNPGFCRFQNPLFKKLTSELQISNICKPLATRIPVTGYYPIEMKRSQSRSGFCIFLKSAIFYYKSTTNTYQQVIIHPSLSRDVIIHRSAQLMSDDRGTLLSSWSRFLGNDDNNNNNRSMYVESESTYLGFYRECSENGDEENAIE
jgi:hypothetical protein